MGFKFDQDSENEDAEEAKADMAGAQTVAGGDQQQPEKSSLAKKGDSGAAQAEESKAPSTGKSIKWFDVIDEFDMTT